jgi:protein-disulfide isomerase
VTNIRDQRSTFGALLLSLLLAAGASAQTVDELARDFAELEEGQQEIRRQLEEIERLLRGRAGARPAVPAGPEVKDRIFDLGANPVKGERTAPLTLVEFTDYQCPYCARHVRETWPQIEKEYVETGKLRYATLDLPLEGIHKLAFKAAEATHCAEQQGRFWEMHDRLFANQRALEPWSGHAEALGLDVAAFDACLEGDLFAAAVRRDMAVAAKVGADGTPSFLIALTDPRDPTKVKGLTFLSGARPFAAFKAEIDRALGESGSR